MYADDLVIMSPSVVAGVVISKARKCYDLVNASYLWLVDRAYDAITRS